MEPVVGALLSRADWLAHGDVSGRSCHSHSCTLIAILHSTLYVTKVTVVDSSEAASTKALSLSLTHLWLHNLCLRKPFRLTNSLAHSLCCTGGKKVTLRLSVCVVRLCRKAVSTEGMQTSTASHFGLFEAPQPQIVARVPLDLMSNDANHGQFRRLFKTLLETGTDILQTSSTHEEVLNICGLLKDFF